MPLPSRIGRLHPPVLCFVVSTSVIKDGVAYIQVGGGVVADSTAEDEHQETLHKAGALLKAIDLAEGRG